MLKGAHIRDVRFQTTHACNHKCPHCFSSAGKPLENELTIDDAKKMIDQLKDMGMRLFTFTGGEPLLRKDFVIELIEYLNQHGVYSRLFTNGYLLNEELAEVLKAKGLNELQISVDGLEKTHNDFRNIKNSFLHAIDGLKFAKNAGLNTFARITVIPQNVHELPELIDMLGRLDITGVRVRPFVSVGRGKFHKLYTLSPKNYEKAFTFLADKRRSTDMNIQLLSPSFSFLYDKAINPDELKPVFKGKGCTCGTELCAITPDGMLKACGYFSQTLGSIREKPIAEMWENHEFVCHLRGISKFNEFCMKCKYLVLCGGGCRASAFENLESFEAPDPLCPLYRQALEDGQVTAEGLQA
jgi:radical SAM protein with 4Fe4S-binding SPASM domain